MARKPSRKKPNRSGNKPAAPASDSNDQPAQPIADPSASGADGPPSAGPIATMPAVPRVISLIVLLGVVALIGVFFFQVMSSFLVPLFLAAVLAVIFKPLHLWSLDQFEGRKELSALATTTIISLLVVVPTAMLGWMAYVETLRVVKIALIDDDSEEAAALIADLAPGEPREPPEPVSAAPESDEPASEEPALEEPVAIGPGDEAPVIAGEPSADESEAVENPAPGGWTDLVWARLEPLSNWYKNNVNAEFDPAELARYSARYAVRIGLVGVQSLVGFALGLAIMIFALYYFFADGPDILVSLMHLSPLDDDYERELLVKFATVSRAVVLATLLSAFVQGLLAGVGYYFVLDSWTPPAVAASYATPEAIPEDLRFQPPIVLLTVLTMLLAIVPFVGATAVWIPVACWVYFAQGDLWPAIGMAVYGAAVVSSIDNVIKPFVLHGQSNLHPLLALLSVLGGIQLLGPVGILVGPMLAAFMQALLGMLRKELDQFQSEPAQAASAEPA